jgi:hypothetical protein
MCIKTTINIRKDILRQINLASKIIKKSRKNIILILLKKYTDQIPDAVMFSPVKYQKREDPSSWDIFHLNFRGDEYEYCCDLRKIYKKSLSLIIAEAIRELLDLLITGINRKIFNNIDSYLFKNYLFSIRNKNGIIYYTCFWGFPGKGTLDLLIT